ncbi:AraC family transcriptional regulator [Paracoccaceae bacterium]
MSHFVLRTADFDSRHRVAEFESVAANICKLAIEPSDAGYSSSTSIAVLPDAVIADTVHSPCQTRRTAQLAAETGDNILLHVPLSGGFTIRQARGAEVECGPGQVYLDPSEVPGLARFVPESSRVLYVSVPRVALLAANPGFNPALRQVAESTPQWRLLIAYARALHAEAGALPPEELQQCSAHLQDLLILALGAGREAELVAQGRGARAARLKTIKADIEANLTRADLGPGWIAARNGISDRYLRSLFAQEGTSFSDYVAARRLMRVHRQLTDPRHAGQSISQIALNAGFGDISWFNARFRAAFGATPSELRAKGSSFSP